MGNALYLSSKEPAIRNTGGVWRGRKKDLGGKVLRKFPGDLRSLYVKTINLAFNNQIQLRRM